MKNKNPDSRFSTAYYTRDFTNDKELAFNTVIFNGKPELTDWLISNYLFNDDPYEEDNVTLPQIKSFIQATNTIASRTAMRAGLDYSVSLQMHTEYIDRINACTKDYQLTEILRTLIYDYASAVQKLYVLDSSHPVVKKVAASVQKFLYEKLTTSVIAEDIRLSSPYICKIFKEETGMTISDYILQQKIAESKLLLSNPDLTINEISALLCFTTPSRFCQQFKKVTGMTPGKFRLEM